MRRFLSLLPIFSLVLLLSCGSNPGTGVVSGVLSGLSCATTAFTGAGTDTCTATLNAAASTTSVAVTLASSDPASVVVPASVTVPSGATAVQFTATIAAVAAPEAVTLTASSGTVSETAQLQLGSYVAGLTATPTTLAFGSTTVGNTASATGSLSSSGTAPVTITSAAISGNGFVLSGITPPVTLNPGQSATYTVAFSPASAGAATGSLTIASNAAPVAVALSGTGTPAPIPPALQSLACAPTSITGAATDTCTVTLTEPAATGGFTAAITSNNASVTVPASVTVASGATMATFATSVLPVTTAQTAVVTVAAGGVSETSTLQLNAAIAALNLSASTLSFGSENLNTTATQGVTLTSTGTIPVTVTSDAVTGAGFSVSGGALPVTLNPGQVISLTVSFDPTTGGAANGSLTVSSTSTVGGTSIVALSGTGVAAAALNALTCTSATLAAGAQTDACTVTLSAAATSAFTVTLSSNNTSVAVPTSVTVPVGGSSASFTASAAQVASAQAAILSASASGVTKTFTIQLTAATTTLSVSATSVTFGNVTVGQTATQTVTVTATGTLPVTISSVAATGTGFSTSGISTPTTLNPGQTAILNLQFAPGAPGAVTGIVTIASNGGNPSIALSGTGEATTTYEVQLTWSAPASSSDPVAGYHVYRALSGTTTWALLTSAVNVPTTYTDTTVVNGQTYAYQVTSVDAAGVESASSNTYTAAIP